MKALGTIDIGGRTTDCVPTNSQDRGKRTWAELCELLVRHAERAAAPLFGAIRSAVDEIRAIDFLGLHLDDDLLLWTLFPFYARQLIELRTGSGVR